MRGGGEISHHQEELIITPLWFFALTSSAYGCQLPQTREPNSLVIYMRMRKKKNLDSRLEAVSEYLTDCEYKDLNFKNAKDNPDLLDLKGIYGSGNPLVLEIGCGKGTFACTYAERHPEINLLAVEMEANVLVSACEKAKAAGLKNIHFMRCNAQYLPAYLPENSVSAIFLNFSCPYPKNTYANHRLTHKSPCYLQGFDTRAPLSAEDG
jgi:tRNA G46 methylase TrmB